MTNLKVKVCPHGEPNTLYINECPNIVHGGTTCCCELARAAKKRAREKARKEACSD
jgi:hypothetical protein